MFGTWPSRWLHVVREQEQVETELRALCAVQALGGDAALPQASWILRVDPVNVSRKARSSQAQIFHLRGACTVLREAQVYHAAMT
mmetsp:Transcript_2859/g.8007  ORF Transcript_2859/g.8007 Transcript_2859/m.8007 type:complete len:85 (+) Transcript_2859:566-820(+)